MNSVKSKSKTDRKSDFSRARTTRKRDVLLIEKNTRFASGSAQTVQYFMDRVLLLVQKCTDIVISGWSGMAFFVLLRFQMYLFEFLTPKPTLLEFK